MHNQIPFKQLRYRLIGASSEDPEHPLFALFSPNQNEGWNSVRFCSYPQEILIQFPQPVRLTRVHLLLHQNKIPSKIELYQFFPKTYNDFYIDYNSMIFDKIGYVIPDSNTKTNYQARELKKISLNENVLFFKLVFYRSTRNIYNKFDQVGLIGLECFGYEFTQTNIDLLFPNRDKEYEYFSNRTNDSYFPKVNINEEDLDEMCRIKIDELKDELDKVLQIENYEYAKVISEFINRIKFLGGKINNLNEIKMKSIEVEDYDNANLMKIEIERIKSIIDSINPSNLGSFNKNNDNEKEYSLNNEYSDNQKFNFNEEPSENPPFDIESEEKFKPKTRSDKILEEKKKKEQMIKENKEAAKQFLKEEKRKEELRKVKLTHGQNKYMDELAVDMKYEGIDLDYNSEDSVREEVRDNSST